MPEMKPQKPQKAYKLSGNVYTDSTALRDKFKENKYCECYGLFVRTYTELSKVEEFIQSQDNLDEYAYIVHDKDVLGDGTPKQIHVHMLLYRKKGFSLTKLIKFMDENTMVQVVRNKRSCYRYLTHLDNPDKVKYSSSAIVEFHRNNNDTFDVTEQEQREKKNQQFIDDLDQLDRRSLAEKYGRDYMLNFRRYEAFRSQVEVDERYAECVTLSAEANPEQEFYFMSSENTEITLNLADYVTIQLRNLMESSRMPTPDELIRIYYEVLSKAREQRQKMARALNVYTEDVGVNEL